MVNNPFDYNSDPDLNTTIGAGDIDIDENCAAANINNAIRAIMANIRDLLSDIGGANTSGGTATVQTLTTSGTLTALGDGTILTWISGFDADAGATLNVDNLGAKALLNNDGSAIAANDFALGQPMCAIYDASADSGNGAWLLVNISQKQIDALTGSNISNTPAGNIVATDVQAAINELDGQDTAIAGLLSAHEALTNNPHSVTATQVGLGDVDNTSDADKPISDDTQDALDTKRPLGVSTIYTVGSGGITLTGEDVYGGIIRVDTEGSSPTDTLSNINGGVLGAIINITTFNNARITTVLDTSGNIRLAGNFVPGDANDTLTLMYNGSIWLEISRAIT